MKFNVLIFLLLALSIQTNAQYAPMVKQITQTVADATIKGDFNALVKYTNPKIVNAMTGKTKTIVMSYNACLA